MRSKWCRSCRRQVLAVYEWPNFALHAMLTVASCGFYLPFALYFSARHKYVCPRCGWEV